MANRPLDPDGSARAEPRYLLDELAAKKLSALLADETRPGSSLAPEPRRREFARIDLKAVWATLWRSVYGGPLDA